MDAVQLAGFGARADPPLGVGVVLAQVAAIGIEISILEPHQVEVIEVAVTRGGVHGHRRHLGVAGGAGGVALLGRKFAQDNQLNVGWGRLIGRQLVK